MTFRFLGHAQASAAPQAAFFISTSRKWGRRSEPRRFLTAASTTVAERAAAAVAPEEKHYIVVGAGLAGLATAYHLLKQSSSQAPVHVTVYDAVGIGAGGSGAAAGLLHPFAPTGKLLWRAQDAMQAALELLEAAETAAAHDPGLPDRIAWRRGMLKPATSSKQSQALWRLYGAQHHHHQQPQQEQQGEQTGSAQLGAVQAVQSMLSAAVVDVSTAQQLVPGVQLPITSAAGEHQQSAPDIQGGLGKMAAERVDLLQHQQQHQQPQPQQHKQRRKQKAAKPPAGWSAEQSAALHIQGGITLQTQQYMHALWKACQQVAAARQDGSSTQLKIQQLHSLADLLHSHSASPTSPAPPDCNSFRQQHSSSSQEQQQQQLQGDCQQLGRQQGQREGQQRRVDAIVVAAGAAVGSLAEIGQQLPLTLCQGYTLDMVSFDAAAVAAAAVAAAAAAGCTSNSAAQSAHTAAGQRQIQSTPHAAAAPSAAAYPAEGPSLLGSPYMASQGGQVLVVGATKDDSYTSQQAVADLGRTVDPSILSNQQPHIRQQQQGPSAADHQAATAGAAAADSNAAAAEVAAAADELIVGAAATWPHIRSWSIGGIRTGVRALPPRSAQGAVPIAGKWMDLLAAGQDVQQAQQQQQQQQQLAQGQAGCQQLNSSVPVWLLVGLGARGLVYHAWLGKLMAAAVLNNSEDQLPPELLAWRQQVSADGCNTVDRQ